MKRNRTDLMLAISLSTLFLSSSLFVQFRISPMNCVSPRIAILTPFLSKKTRLGDQKFPALSSLSLFLEPPLSLPLYQALAAQPQPNARACLRLPSNPAPGRRLKRRKVGRRRASLGRISVFGPDTIRLQRVNGFETTRTKRESSSDRQIWG